MRAVRWEMVVLVVLGAIGAVGCVDRVEYGWQLEEPEADVGAPEPDVGQAEGPCVVEVPERASTDTFLFSWTADDFGEVWIDGERVGASADWREVAEVVRPLGPGKHVIAARVEDRMRVSSGFVARGAFVTNPSLGCLDTGDGGAWRVTTRRPSGDWRGVGYDDAEWVEPTVADDCRDNWAGTVDLEPAQWVWGGSCDAGSEQWREENWYRLVFELRRTEM